MYNTQLLQIILEQLSIHDTLRKDIQKLFLKKGYSTSNISTKMNSLIKHGWVTKYKTGGLITYSITENGRNQSY